MRQIIINVDAAVASQDDLAKRSFDGNEENAFTRTEKTPTRSGNVMRSSLVGTKGLNGMANMTV